jgi:hypothetical protein
MSTTTNTDTTEHPPQMLLPQWMYRQIITDHTVKAVWCFCGAPAISYCNGSQFVCYGGGHFGMPMVMLKRRAGGQAFVEAQCRKGRERLRAEIEATETRQQGRRRK